MPNKLFLACLVFSSVGLNATGQTLLKLGAVETSWNLTKAGLLLGGIGAYGVSTILYIILLKSIKLSVAYPLLIGLTLCATTVAGATILSEKVSLIQWFGVGLIVSGLAAIGFGR